MTVSGFRGTISDITQWMGYSGNMKMVVALKPSGGGTGKMMEGTAALNKGKGMKPSPSRLEKLPIRRQWI